MNILTMIIIMNKITFFRPWPNAVKSAALIAIDTSFSPVCGHDPHSTLALYSIYITM